MIAKNVVGGATCGEYCESTHGDQCDPDFDELVMLRARCDTLATANRLWSTMVDRLRAELAGSVNECSAAKRERDLLYANNDQQELLILELRERAGPAPASGDLVTS